MLLRGRQIRCIRAAHQCSGMSLPGFCQRLTGSAFFVRALFLKEHVQITGEVTAIASSNDLTRRFCPHCGSQIFAERKSRPDAIAIALGSFDQLDGIFPTEHVWVSDRQEWLSIPADVEQHRET